MKHRSVLMFPLAVCLVAIAAYLVLPPLARMLDGGEAARAHEWSVLQGIEFAHRGEQSSAGVVIIHKALGSELDVIGIARARPEDGYLWIIANPVSSPPVKVLPQVSDGIVTPTDLQTIKTLPSLRAEVLHYVETLANRAGDRPGKQGQPVTSNQITPVELHALRQRVALGDAAAQYALTLYVDDSSSTDLTRCMTAG